MQRTRVFRRFAALRTWLDDITRRTRHPSSTMMALSVVVTAALYCSRSGDAILHPQFIAEDGAIFFQEAKLFGLETLVLPYSGYLHLIPRMVALVANLFTTAAAPTFYIAASVAIVIWSAATIATANLSYAWLLAPLCMAAPGGEETFGTLTNVQWLTQAALLLVITSSTPSKPSVRSNQIAFTVAASLSGPFSIFATPLAAWRICTHKTDRHSWLVGGIVLVAAMIQLNFVLRVPSPYEGIRAPLHLLPVMLDRWVGQVSHTGLTDKPVRFRQDLFMGGAMLLACATGSRELRMLYVYAATVLAGTFLRFIPDSYYFDSPGVGERYFYIPRLIILWSLVLALLRVRWYSALMGVALIMMSNSFERWQKAPWPILPWRSEAWKIDQGRPVRIIINPSPADETRSDAWRVELPAMP